MCRARGLGRVSVVALVTFGLAGCSASSPDPRPTVTPTPSPIAPVATNTPDLEVADATLPPSEMCPDPYVNGAPYVPEDGEPIRLQSTGSSAPLERYEPLPFETDAALQALVLEQLSGQRRHFGVVIKNVADGRGVVLAPDREFYAASLYKLWVMLEAFHQREVGMLDFDEPYIASDYYVREFGLNEGELALCDQITIRAALSAMIRISDNVAANLLLDRVGAGHVNTALAGLGLEVSMLAADGSLPITAEETALLLEAIVRGEAVSGEASREMLALLLSQVIDDRLPALLPDETLVAHKTGNWFNATHDAGIVFAPKATYVIVVLSDYGFDHDAAPTMASLSRAVYDYYNGG